MFVTLWLWIWFPGKLLPWFLGACADYEFCYLFYCMFWILFTGFWYPLFWEWSLFDLKDSSLLWLPAPPRFSLLLNGLLLYFTLALFCDIKFYCRMFLLLGTFVILPIYWSKFIFDAYLRSSSVISCESIFVSWGIILMMNAL